MKPHARILSAAGLLVLAASLVATGCSKSSDAPGGRPVEVFPAVGKPAAVKLLEAGSGQTYKLRWNAKKGGTARLVMKVGTKIEMEVAGQSPPAMETPMEMTMAMTYSEVTDDTIKMDFKYESASMNMPGLPASMADDLSDELKKITGSMTIDTRGVVKSFDMDLPKSGMLAMGGTDQLMNQMKDQVGKLSMPFPEEAIAVGGKWEILETVELMGMKMRTAYTMKLVEFDGTKGKLEMTMEQVAAKGEMKLPGMAAASVKAVVEKAVTKATGTVTFNLNTPFVMGGSMKGSTEMEAEISAMGETQSMEMKMSMDLGFKPLPGSAKNTVAP